MSMLTALILPYLLLASGAGGLVQALPDPTRPSDYAPLDVSEPASAQANAYRVSAIRISSAGRVAIVNGNPVRSGDQLSGAIVRAIEADGVVLDIRRERIKIPLINFRVKTSPKQPK